jgi:hypothetical protein
MTIFDDDFGVFPGAFVFKWLADFSGSRVVINVPDSSGDRYTISRESEAFSARDGSLLGNEVC